MTGKRQSLHFNHESTFPPVNCPILIRKGRQTLKVERTSYITDKNNDMEYVTETGKTFSGRFPWTYP